MVERDGYAPGTPSWVDLGTSDVDASVAFYGALFGWEAPPAMPETGGYRIFHLRGRSVAGVGPRMDPNAPPWWTTYVSVESADETVARVQAAGGSVLVPPMDVLDVGRMAVCADTVGAVFALWQPRAHKGAGLCNEPGTFCWNELACRDVETARRFYAAVFGWGGEPHPMGETSYTELTLDGNVVAGMIGMTDQWPAGVPSHWMVYFAVEDCDAAAARVVELGGTVSVPPTDIPPGRFAVVADPQGAMFSVIAMAAPPP
jgi:predicted enzyme related to lactoylglutathione lyase